MPIIIFANLKIKCKFRVESVIIQETNDGQYQCNKMNEIR